MISYVFVHECTDAFTYDYHNHKQPYMIQHARVFNNDTKNIIYITVVACLEILIALLHAVSFKYSSTLNNTHFTRI